VVRSWQQTVDGRWSTADMTDMRAGKLGLAVCEVTLNQ